MTVSIICTIILTTVSVHNVWSAECPGITKLLQNTAGIVGRQASMSFTACQTEGNPEFVAIQRDHHSKGEQRIWDSHRPDDQENPAFSVSYPENFYEEDKFELNFKEITLDMGGKYTAKFLLGAERPETSAVFVAVKSMEGSCPKATDSKIDQEEITMICEVDFRGDGVLKPLLTWRDIDSVDSVQFSNQTQAGKLRSKAVITASADIHGRIFTCDFKLDDSSDVLDYCNTSYNVEYKVSDITILPDPYPNEIVTVSVGDEIRCTANGNPKPSYSWTCGGQITLGSKLTITEEFQAKTDCSCTAWNRVNGVETRAKREVSLMIEETAEPESSTDKRGEWVIAVSIIVPLVVIGILVGVFLYWKKLRNRSSKSSVPDNGTASTEKPSYDNRNFQGSNPNIQPKLAPGNNVVQAPQYENFTQQGYPGKGSPGYADLGVKHLTGSLPGSTSTINSIPDQQVYVNKDPSGARPQGASKPGDTPV